VNTPTRDKSSGEKSKNWLRGAYLSRLNFDSRYRTSVDRGGSGGYKRSKERSDDKRDLHI